MLRIPVGEDLDDVVADAVHRRRTSFRERIGEGFEERHLGGTSEGAAFVVVVAEYSSVGDRIFAFHEEFCDFEDGLRGLSVDVVHEAY